MAEAVLDWPTIMTAIQAELAAVVNTAGAPAFGENVIAGEPIGLPLGGPYACFWYLGRENARTANGAPASYGNVMYAARIQVMCLWPRQDRATLAAWEADIATIDTNIRRRFRANSTTSTASQTMWFWQTA